MIFFRTIRILLVSTTVLACLMLSGCAGVATVLSCGAEVFSRESVGTRYQYRVALDVETAGGTDSRDESVECEIVDHFCGGGSWFPQWKRSPDIKYYEFNSSAVGEIRIEAPTCTMLKQETRHGVPATYIYSSVAIEGDDMEGVGDIKRLLKPTSLEENGVWLRKYVVERVEQ